jgi:hypothetical protein
MVEKKREQVGDVTAMGLPFKVPAVLNVTCPEAK